MTKHENTKLAGVQHVDGHTVRLFIIACAAVTMYASPVGAAENAQQRLWVARYTISGENPVTVAELANVLAEHRHQEASLPQLEAQAEEMTN